ncbi:hypothetical protein H5407_09875 [Mitsuaria sp. WAJ17]|uniref:hypothetical protein n=1 Tax=Mitsuaria sp. WAJ17 TaxID=2761452 RepID=UPI001601A603|nr:hypothetical protein [Mitsuaria sp. WAJ17]MBB2485532.1 hypothetical protein [Mitsuaria sp. WAJ17]
MSSTGTRVVPTLTEVLDEQRLSKPASNLSTEAWPSSRRGDEELVPISLDWGDETATPEATGPAADAGGVMTPWQVVQPRAASGFTDDAPFIDLSIDVAPVQAPALHDQMLDVFALPPASASDMPPSAAIAWPSADLEMPLPAADGPGPAVDAYAAALHAAEVMGEPALAQLPPALTETGPAPLTDTAGDLVVEAVAPAPAGDTAVPVAEAAAASAGMPAAVPVEMPVAAPAEVPAAVLNILAAAGAAAALAPSSMARAHHGTQASSPALDPGMHAVRQGGEHVPGISEERLQAILQQALDRLLRDELPSALVETLIRLSPQLSESLIESLKPSLHLHVMEALSAEALSSHEGRPKA